MRPAAVHPFLMALLRGTDAAALVPSPSDHQEWERLVQDAAQQGLTFILSRRINESGLGSSLPPVILDQIKAHVLRPAAQNLVLADELAPMLRACAARRLPCAPLRGLALSEQLYGESTARPTGDIDLLVRRKDLSETVELLRDFGFKEFEHRPGFARAFSYTLELLKDRHGWIVVEPHWTIAYPPFADRVDMEAVWSRCVRRTVLGIETWALGREDLFLHLCFHYLHHGDNAPLLWLYELDRLIRQDQTAPDWTHVARLARQMEQDLLLAEVLRRLTDTFATPVPNEVFSQLATSAPPVSNRSIAGSAPGRLARALTMASCATAREELALFFTLKGIRAKLRYVSGLLFPSPEFMRLRYGLSSRSQLGFGYLRRTVYVVWEGCRGVFSLFVLRRSGPSATH